MTAAKVMDVIARLPGCAGQAADAASAYTQVKVEDAPKLLKIPKSECPGFWIRLPRHKWPKSCANIEDPVVPPLYVSMMDDIKVAGKKQNMASRDIDETCFSWRTNIIS